MTLVRTRSKPVAALPAGMKVPVAALGEDGTVVMDDGSIVHGLACYPTNYDMLTGEGREAAALNFQEIAASLRPGQVIEITVDMASLTITDALRHVDDETHALMGFRPSATPAHAVASLTAPQRASWGSYAMLHNSLQRSAPADGRLPCRRLRVATRFVPGAQAPSPLWGALPAWMPGSGRRMTAVQDGANRLERTIGEHAQVVQQALREVAGLQATLGREGTTAVLLDGRAVLRDLESRLNGDDGSAAVEDSEDPGCVLSRFDSAVEHDKALERARALSGYLARRPLDFRESPYHVRVGPDLVRTLHLGGHPASTHTGWLNALLTTSHVLPTTVTVILRGMDRGVVQDQVYRQAHQAQRQVEERAKKGQRDIEGRRARDDKFDLAETLAEDPMAGLVEMWVLCRIRSPATQSRQAGLLVDEVVALQRAARSATHGGDLLDGYKQQETLFTATLGLCKPPDTRPLCVETRHVGDTSPLIGATFGSKSGLPLCVGVSGEPHFFDPFDDEHRAASFVVVGLTGTGKTMLVNRLLLQLCGLGARCVVFDRAGHYEVLASLIVGAQILRLGGSSKDALNQWDVDDVADVPHTKVEFLAQLHRVMLGRAMDKSEERVLKDAIRATYRYCAARNFPPRESEFIATLQASVADMKKRGLADGRYFAITERLLLECAEYAGDGTHAQVWDRLTTVSADSPLLIVDYSDVADPVLPAVVFKMLEWTRRYTTRIFRAAMREPGSGYYHGRCGIVLDEAHAWSGVPEIANYVAVEARETRRRGTVFGVVSQDAKDFSGVAEPVLTNAPHKIFFEQSPRMLEFLRDTLTLAPETMKRLTKLRTVKGRYSEALFLNGGRGGGFVRVVVAAEEYWAFTSHPRDVGVRTRAIADHGGNVWAAISWLAREHGIPTPAAGTVT